MKTDTTRTTRKLLLGVFLMVAAAFVVAGLPLLLGQVTPGSMYGVRLPEATNDPDLWFRVNTLAGAWMAGLGVLTAVLAVAFYRRPTTNNQYSFWVAFPLMAGILLGLVLLKLLYLS